MPPVTDWGASGSRRFGPLSKRWKVRGAPPNDNGYFLDGIRVPQLFHIGLGPGVIHPQLIDRIDFYPGVAPARFGGFTGGLTMPRM